jgi:AbrB family looped-hinge helix DNA binding protein
MEATLSSKNQIVIPREARKSLGVKPGDKLLIVPRGSTVIVMAKPENYAEALLGLGKGLYPEGYLEAERNSWE